MSQILKPKKGYKLVKGTFGKYEEIPEEWQIKNTSDIMNVTMGQSPPSESYNKDQKGLPFYQGVTDFGTMYPNPTVWCIDSRKIAEKNSILFSVRAPVGEINLTKTKCCLGRGVAALNPLESDLWYCYYLVNQNRNRFSVFSQGTTYDAINQGEIAKTKLPYTKNIQEQQKIASTLSNIDNLITNTHKIIDQTKSLRKGLMQKLLTKGISHNKFKKVKWLFGKEIEIPIEWEIKPLEKCVKEIITYGIVQAGKNIEQGIPYVRTSDMNGNKLTSQKMLKTSKEIASKFQRSTIRTGELVFAIRATGVSELVKPMEITFENFLAYVSKFKSPRARTALIKNKAEQVIQENYSHNPAYYEKLWQLLQRLISEEKERRKENANYFDSEMENKVREIYKKVLSEKEERKKLGFEIDIEFSIFGLIQEYKEDKDNSIKITKALSEKLIPKTEIVEWYNKPGIKRKMEEITYDVLDSFKIPEEDISKLSEKILTLLNKDNL